MSCASHEVIFHGTVLVELATVPGYPAADQLRKGQQTELVKLERVIIRTAPKPAIFGARLEPDRGSKLRVLQVSFKLSIWVFIVSQYNLYLVYTILYALSSPIPRFPIGSIFIAFLWNEVESHDISPVFHSNSTDIDQIENRRAGGEWAPNTALFMYRLSHDTIRTQRLNCRETSKLPLKGFQVETDKNAPVLLFRVIKPVAMVLVPALSGTGTEPWLWNSCKYYVPVQYWSHNQVLGAESGRVQSSQVCFQSILH